MTDGLNLRQVNHADGTPAAYRRRSRFGEQPVRRGGGVVPVNCERSEAIQTCIRGESLDCFAAPLLAMT
jgi:hypothetical protein